MIKLDKTVKKETLYITAWVVILSALMQSVFLIISAWNYKVLLGNLLSAIASIGNFILLGITVQKCLQKSPEDAKKLIKASQKWRLLMLLVVALLGALVPIFNVWATVIPLLFPRIAFMVRPFLGKKGGEKVD